MHVILRGLHRDMSTLLWKYSFRPRHSFRSVPLFTPLRVSFPHWVGSLKRWSTFESAASLKSSHLFPFSCLHSPVSPLSSAYLLSYLGYLHPPPLCSSPPCSTSSAKNFRVLVFYYFSSPSNLTFFIFFCCLLFPLIQTSKCFSIG